MRNQSDSGVQQTKAGSDSDGIVSLLSAIFDSSDDAIISKTLNGIVTSWNPAAERMFGYTAAEAVGRSIRLIIPAELQAEEEYVLDCIRHGQKVDHFETIRQAKDGHRLSISLTVSPIRNASGTVVGASKIARDITERKHLEALLSSIVACSDDAIVSKNLDGIITSWNPAAERMFGYTSAEVLGKSVRLIIPPELQDEEDFVLSRIRSGGQVDHFETVRQTKDGRRLNISLTVSPIRDVQGNVIGASKIVRDITEKKKLEQDRLVALQRLSEALAGRDEFIAVAAHELRNPLNGLTLLMRLLEKTLAKAGSSQRNLAESSKSQLARLSLLVNRLLDVTRIRFGTFDLYRQTFNLNDLIREVTGRTEHSEASFSMRLGPPIVGNWDRLRIDQVVTNLITNAIKYGMEKPILIAASEDSDHAIISVRDHGKGLSPEDQERIFERFGPVGERSHNRGLGMGLWITRQIVEAHCGTITVESELGQGSIFTVRLPLNQ